jgi:hypothetical protein
MKSVWISSLAVPEQDVRAQMQKLKTYGLEASGHQWSEDNQAMAWLGPKVQLCDANCALWVLMGSREAMLKHELRYGLSLLALCVQARRGPAFPIVILQTDTAPLDVDELPTPLQRAVILSAVAASTPAKLVAKAHAKAPDLQAAYYFDMVGDPQRGQWFEVHPTQGTWPGIIFGINEGQIKFQAVGPAGNLPATSTLNYPMQGIKLAMGETEFTAWGTRNEVNPDMAYFIKVEGFPKTLLFGAFSEENEAEMYMIKLQ